MPVTIEAVYEHGVFRPLQPVILKEGQKVHLWLGDVEDRLTPEEMLQLAEQVYQGLSEEDLAEVESMVLDRSHFMRPDPEQEALG